MLVLSRDCDTAIRIGTDVKVKVLSIRKQRVKLGIDAPSHVRVWRDEISPEADRNHPPAAPSPRAAGGVDPFPILLVEGDRDFARLLAKVLLECQFPDVAVASTGAAAIRALGNERSSTGRAGAPKLILLGADLPDMPCLDVLRHIRSNRRLQSTPVVVLRQPQGDEEVDDYFESGIDAFVGRSAQYWESGESVCRLASFWRELHRAAETATEAVGCHR